MKDRYVIGLTGSIATGKTTVSRFLKNVGFDIFDADKEVSDILRTDQHIIQVIKNHWPDCFDKQTGALLKKSLAHQVFSKPSELTILEKLIHPYVERRQAHFLSSSLSALPLVIESPLLFETSSHHRCHLIIVTTCAADTQKKRVLKRPGMTESLYLGIIKRQMSEPLKCQRANYMIDTTQGALGMAEKIRKIIEVCHLQKTRKPS